MGMLLFIIAFVLLPPMIVVSYVHLLLNKNAKGYWKSLAVDIDIFGNRAFRSFWNAALIKSNGYKFGKWGETISSALGKNERDGTLLPVGKGLVKLLDLLDENHCQKSIDDTQEHFREIR